MSKQPQDTELSEPQLNPESKNSLINQVSKNEHTLPGKEAPVQKKPALSMNEWKQQIQANRNGIGNDKVKVNPHINHER